MVTDDDDEAMRVIRATMAMTMTKTMVRITIWQRGEVVAKPSAGCLTLPTDDDLVTSRVTTW